MEQVPRCRTLQSLQSLESESEALNANSSESYLEERRVAKVGINKEQCSLLLVMKWPLRYFYDLYKDMELSTLCQAHRADQF